MVNDKGATVHDVDDTEKNNEDTKDNGDEVADDADIGEKQKLLKTLILLKSTQMSPWWEENRNTVDKFMMNYIDKEGNDSDCPQLVCKNIKSTYQRKGSLNKHIFSVHEAHVTVIIAPRSFRVN